MVYQPALSLSQFDFQLPAELIAQHPSPQRDRSRLFVVDRRQGSFAHKSFHDFPGYLQPGDAVILNDTRVRPVRLKGTINGKPAELLLVEQRSRNRYLVMAKPGKRLVEGARIEGHDWQARCLGSMAYQAGMRLPEIEFSGEEDIETKLDHIGLMPLPPYIKRPATKDDQERYQTVFSRHAGAIAAPTAGLHFTQATLQEVERRGAQVGYVTLHVGIGTFAPVRNEDITQHVMHQERFVLSAETAQRIETTRQAGKRVCAVGTTVSRVLETCSQGRGKQLRVQPQTGETDIFIHPPYEFKAIDMLLTNFHLPRTTLLMMVSAFAGRELILAAYEEAIREKYRFFSYGDAMLIV